MAVVSVWVILLCALDLAVAHPPTPFKMGHITGTVRVGPHGAPAKYATVFIRERRQGTQADSSGGFWLAVEPGRVVVKTFLIGFRPHEDTVLVVAGQVDTLDVLFESRWTRLQDSLERVGKWPPRLDPRIARAIRAAKQMTVTTYSPGILPPGTTRQEDRRPWPMEWRDSLLAGLEVADYTAPLQGAKMLCECEPEDVSSVTLSSGPAFVRISICCGTVGIRCGDVHQEAFLTGAVGKRFDRWRRTFGVAPVPWRVNICGAPRPSVERAFRAHSPRPGSHGDARSGLCGHLAKPLSRVKAENASSCLLSYSIGEL